MEHPGAVQDLLLAVFFVLAALAGRNILNTGFIERPLVLGLFWWGCTGEYAPALPLAIFFELFWLDLIPSGGYIPPGAFFPYLMVLLLSRQFGWNNSASLAIPLAVTLPLAYVIPWLESRQRDYQKFASSRLTGEARKNFPLGALPLRLITISAAQQGIGVLCVFIGTHVLASHIFMQLHDYITFSSSGASWGILYIVAAVGSLLSLRIYRAYVFFFVCMALLFVNKIA